MKRVLRTATLVMIGLLAAPLAVAAEMQSFWDLKPQQLRVLVAAPQVMVTRTASGLDAYCRCPVVLKPHEIPEAMKKAIIAVEDKRFMDHGGIDLIALGSVLRGGLSRGGSTIPMQLLKNLVFHDLQRRDVLSKLERHGDVRFRARFRALVHRRPESAPHARDPIWFKCCGWRPAVHTCMAQAVRH